MMGRISVFTKRYLLSFEWKRVGVMDIVTAIMMGQMRLDE